MIENKKPLHYLEKVYWLEETSRNKFEVMSGTLLAEYDDFYGTKYIRRYIVTLGRINSCVVRHITKYFTDVKDAYIELAEKENK